MFLWVKLRERFIELVSISSAGLGLRRRSHGANFIEIFDEPGCAGSGEVFIDDRLVEREIM